MAYKKIILRRDTAANWTSANPTLVGGEIGIETDTLKAKLGNGSTAWTSLGYYAPPSIDDVGDVTITSASSGQFLKWNGSAWVNDTIDLGTDTAGGYVASLVAGTGVSLSNNSGETATPTIAIGQAVGTTSNVTFNDLVVSGNLTVSGTTTTLNTETMTINDNIIVLNNNATGSPTENAGIEIERGSATNVVLRWNEDTDVWEATVNGSTYSEVITALTLEERLGEEHWHRPVVLATAAVLPNTPTYTAGSADLDGGTGIGATLESSSNARISIDGTNGSTGDRVLVKDQVSASHNGIYTVTAQGSASAHWVLTRATDVNGSTAGQITKAEIVGVSLGTANHDQGFNITSTGTGTNGAHIIGTDNITWVQYTGVAAIDFGAGLSVTGNQVNVVSAAGSLTIDASNIELATVARSNTAGSAGSSFLSGVTTDSYGRVTAVETSTVEIALGTNTSGSYVSTITGGTGVESSAASSGESTTHTLSIGQSVSTSAVPTFAGLNLSATGAVVFEGTTDNAFETTLSAGDPTVDRAIVLPNKSGTVILGTDTVNDLAVPASSFGMNSQRITSLGTPTTSDDAVTKLYVDTADDLKANLASPTFTGTVTIPSGASISGFALLASPTLTGIPTAPTASSVTNSTQIATTAFVQDLVTSATAANTVELGVDTTGSYVASLVAGTGVTLANNSGEGTTPTVTVDTAVIAPLASPTFTGTVVLPSTTSIGTITNTELSYVDGVTSAIQTQIDAKAPLASPALTGIPTAPTAALTTNTTQVATTEFVRAEVAALVGTAGATLDTLGEIATALGNDVALSTTLTTSIGLKSPIASPTFTGTVTIPTGSSITLPTVASGINYSGSTSGTTKLQASATASGTITLPAITGTVITTGDTDTVTSTMILDGTILNADINASAAIAYSKLSLGTSITNSDISTTAAIDRGKIADVSTNAQVASYTLVLADKNKIVEMNVASENTLTVPPNSSVAFPVGSQINVLQTGAGQCTITAGAGVTVNGTPGLKVRTQYSYVTIIKRATDTWVVVGDLSA